jgi:hypothetical protein
MTGKNRKRLPISPSVESAFPGSSTNRGDLLCFDYAIGLVISILIRRHSKGNKGESGKLFHRSTASPFIEHK